MSESFATSVIKLGAVRDLRTEVDALEAWYGPNAYSAFLRKHGRRPSREEAAAIGRRLGGRVKADDGSMQPALSKTDRAVLKEIRARREVFARRYKQILQLKEAITALAQIAETCDVADILGDRNCLLDSPEVVVQLDSAVCWLNRFAEHWYDRTEATCTKDPEFSRGHQGEDRS